MNPLNRKMFRQPGMSRQPAGILASSPELANVVRQRMGQPVQMADGGQNVTNYMSAIKDLAAKGDKATLNNIARDQRLPRSVQMAAANALAGRTVPGQIQTAPVPAPRLTPDEIARSRGPELAAMTAGKPQGTNMSDIDASPLIDQGIAAAKSAISGDYMRPITDAIVRGARSDIDAISNAVAGQKIDTEITDFEVPRVTLPDDIPAMPGEEIADQVTLPKSTRDALDDEDGAILPKPNPDRGDFAKVDIGAAGLGVEPPSSGDSKTEEAATADQKVMPTDPTDLLPQISKAQDDPKNKTAKQKAAATDSVLNIKNLKERKALLKSLLGEEKAKDIRTDAGYNLMMTGLMIAAGQSGDAMTNIAKGLAGGLQGYGTATGEAAQAEKKLDRELSLLAYSELSDEQKTARAAQAAEDARIADRVFRASESDKKLAFQKAENALSRFSQKELKEMGFDNAFKIAELGVDSRQKIAELNRKNQMEIAQLPSGEIRGLLQIYGNDNEKVREYLEAKNKLKSKDTDTDDLTAALTRIIEGKGTAEDTARLLASSAGQTAITNAGNLPDAAKEILGTMTENKTKRGDRKNKPNDGFGEMTTTN